MKGKDLLVTLFVLAGALLSWPLLTVVNRPRALFGVPLLVLSPSGWRSSASSSG